MTTYSKTLRITPEAHKAMVEHLKYKVVLLHWVSEAILEKIEREKKCKKK